MKITHNKVGQNLNLSDLSKTEASKTESAKASKTGNANAANPVKEILQNKSAEAVKVDLSSQAKDIRQAKELAMGSPDIDFAKVEKFQKLIDEGKYKVDSKAVADRMVEDSLMMAGARGTDNE